MAFWRSRKNIVQSVFIDYICEQLMELTQEFNPRLYTGNDFLPNKTGEIIKRFTLISPNGQTSVELYTDIGRIIQRLQAMPYTLVQLTTTLSEIKIQLQKKFNNRSINKMLSKIVANLPRPYSTSRQKQFLYKQEEFIDYLLESVQFSMFTKPTNEPDALIKHRNKKAPIYTDFYRNQSNITINGHRIYLQSPPSGLSTSLIEQAYNEMTNKIQSLNSGTTNAHCIARLTHQDSMGGFMSFFHLKAVSSLFTIDNQLFPKRNSTLTIITTNHDRVQVVTKSIWHDTNEHDSVSLTIVTKLSWDSSHQYLIVNDFDCAFNDLRAQPKKAITAKFLNKKLRPDISPAMWRQASLAAAE